MSVDGRKNALRLKNFVALVSHWDLPGVAVRAEAEAMVRAITVHLDAVLVESGLAADLVNRYRSVVRENMAVLGI
jgi:hypothetical protein